MNDEQLREHVRKEFVQPGFITVHQWRNFIDYLGILIEKEKAAQARQIFDALEFHEFVNTRNLSYQKFKEKYLGAEKEELM